jgi:hypothetical protein
MSKDSLLTMLDEAFDKKSWHGPNLRGSIRGVTAEQAAWRPRPGGHNIWELTLHAAYWKYVVRRRITKGKRGSFALAGSNFFTRPVELTESAWRKDIQILESAHRDLRAVVPQASGPALLYMIRSAAFHDIYHAGQIRLLRRLMEEKK